MLFSPFHAIRDAAEQAWRKTQFDEAALPRLITGIYRKNVTLRKLTTTNLIRAMGNADVDESSRQPTALVATSSRLRVGVGLFARMSEIHQHDYAGAMLIIGGDVLLGEYRFTGQHVGESDLAVGSLTSTHLRILSHGDVLPIHGGALCIHAIAPLGMKPSGFVVVRSSPSERFRPRYDFLPPGIAFCRSHVDRLSECRGQLLELLRLTEHPLHKKGWDDCIEWSTPAGALATLLAEAKFLPKTFTDPMKEKVVRRFGPLGTAMWRALEVSHHRTRAREALLTLTDPKEILTLSAHLLSSDPRLVDSAIKSGSLRIPGRSDETSDGVRRTHRAAFW